MLIIGRRLFEVTDRVGLADPHHHRPFCRETRRSQYQVTRLYARDLDLEAYDRQVRVFLAEVDRDLARVPRVSRGPTPSPSAGFVVKRLAVSVSPRLDARTR